MESGELSHSQQVAAAEYPASHQLLDHYQLALHHRVAELLVEEPEPIIARARRNLNRWIESENFTEGELAALTEWAGLLDRLTTAELIRRITDPSEEGQRIRQNSPFVRILPTEESRRIREECEKTAAR